MALEGLISLTSLTTTGATVSQPLVYFTVTSPLALVGGITVGGLVGYQVSKRILNKQKENLRQELLNQAKSQLEEVIGLRETVAETQAGINLLLKATSAAAPQTAQVDDVAEAPQSTVDDVAEAPQSTVDEVAEAGETADVPAETPIPDDLRKITGIGQAFARRLNEAGIWTFADLASADPEKLKEILPWVKDKLNPEEWIAQARQLVAESEDQT